MRQSLYGFTGCQSDLERPRLQVSDTTHATTRGETSNKISRSMRYLSRACIARASRFSVDVCTRLNSVSYPREFRTTTYYAVGRGVAVQETFASVVLRAVSSLPPESGARPRRSREERGVLAGKTTRFRSNSPCIGCDRTRNVNQRGGLVQVTPAST